VRRVLLVLTVALVMAVMMVATAGTAFAVHPDFHPTPANHHATGNPAGDITTCTVDPVCGETQVGKSTHDPFPLGQFRFQNH